MEKEFVKLENNEKTMSKLLAYMRANENDFDIPLSSIVDLFEYTKKMLEKGVVIAAIDNDRILAIGGIYCNDKLGKKAYGTIISITKEAQEKGYHLKNFLYASFIIAQKEGMKEFHAETTNPRVFVLHKRLGFVELYQEEHNGVIHHHTYIKDIDVWLNKNSDIKVSLRNE